MDTDFSVRVVDAEGEPVAGAEVYVSFPTTWSSETTDEDGWASFSKFTLIESGVRATISVNGEKVATEWIEDGDTFSFTVPD